MNIREPEPEETERIREMVDSAMTTSYRLSPQQIDAITTVAFGDDALTAALSDDDAVVLVAENGVENVDTAVAGVVLGGVTDGVGEIRWLLVDPEHRGAGLGTALFETASDALRERDVEYVRATTLEANIEGHQFFERFDFARTAERETEFGDETLVEYVYTESSATGEKTDAAQTDATRKPTDSAETDVTGTDGEDLEFPDTEVSDGRRTATTEDSQHVYVDTDDRESGADGPFFAVYIDEELTEPYGYYCANCGSLDVLMDDMTRMECSECGNSHASRSSGTYDDSYL